VKGDNGCPDTFSLKLVIVDDYVFYLPNAFTPNKDSKNEIFKPEVSGVYDYEFFVFDRWGELIFQTTNTDEGWDGTYKGEKCQQDVYVYKIRYFDIVENLPHQKAGTFSLIR
jgi:gliding motility-associated-like protein